jgi:hypothetical protein
VLTTERRRAPESKGAGNAGAGGLSPFRMSRMTRRDVFAAGLGAALAAGVFLLVSTLGSPKASGQRGERAPKSTSAPSSAETGAPETDETWREANASLAQQVKVYQQRLAKNEAEKTAIQRQLDSAKTRLAASEGDGAVPRDPYDLTQDDWKKLAATGTVKARFPCSSNGDWKMKPETAAALGLSPADTATVEAALKRQSQAMWSSVASSCASAVGSGQLAERLGLNVCTEIVSQGAKSSGSDLQRVADVRAGNVPMPTADKLDPYETLLMAETNAMPALVDELSQSFGPELAKQIAYSDVGGSWCSGTSGGAPPTGP